MLRQGRALIPRLGRIWTPRLTTGRVVVLCYHSIHPSKGFASATPALFRLHLRWLAEHCQVVPLRHIIETESAHQHRPTVAITFDDGYADNFEFALPVLADYGFTATFFLTLGLIEKAPDVVARIEMLRRSSYDDIRPLEWSQVKDLRSAGMEIGAHTWSHPNLALLSRPRAREELQQSKDVLEQRLGEPVRTMAYPFGKPRRHFTPETVAVAEELGYECACAVLFRGVRPRDSKLAIPRFFITNDPVEVMRDKVWGAWDLLGAWQERGPIWAARLVSPEDFLE